MEPNTTTPAAGAATPAQTPGHTPAPNSALLRPVEQKGYTGANIAVDPNKLQQPLPEAQIGMSQAEAEGDPFMSDINKEKLRKEAERKASSAAGGSSAGPGKTAGPTKPKESLLHNPGLNDLPPEDKQMAAERLAKILLDNYQGVWEWVDGRLQISEHKLMDIRTAGEIDMDTPIPIEAGTVTFLEFVHVYNEQIKGTVGVSQSFIDDVEPPLVRVLAKHGAGVSDEQFLAIKFGTHAVGQGRKFWAQQLTMKAFMRYGMELTKAHREQGSPVQAAAPPPPPPPPQQAAAPAPPQDGYSDPGPGDSTGAVQHMEVRKFGMKDDMRTLSKAASKFKKSNITATIPEGNRRRASRAGGKKK